MVRSSGEEVEDERSRGPEPVPESTGWPDGSKRLSYSYYPLPDESRERIPDFTKKAVARHAREEGLTVVDSVVGRWLTNEDFGDYYYAVAIAVPPESCPTA